MQKVKNAIIKKSTRLPEKIKTRSLALYGAGHQNAFIANNAPIFESLIHFQLRFGGYIFNAGLEPIKFSLLKGEGGYPKSRGTSIIEFEESGLTTPKYYFDCAMTNYQMQFFLDENGVYYEDYEAKASTFAKVVEHLALWDEIRSKANYEVLYRDKRLSTDSVDKLSNLTLLPEASDQYTLWSRNEFMYMQQCQGLTTLIVSENYPEKDQLRSL
jgi:hypothetical protein